MIADRRFWDSPMMLDNLFLALLARSISELLDGRLKALKFIQGEDPAEPNAPINRLIFPGSGLVSVVVDLKEWRSDRDRDRRA
jgi:hypothetical protein